MFPFPPLGKPPLLQPVYNAQVRAMLQTLIFNFHNLTELYISQFFGDVLVWWFWGFVCLFPGVLYK